MTKVPNAPIKDSAPKADTRKRVRAVHGTLRHLFTNEVFTPDSDKKVEIDSFVQSQIDAGKLEIVND